ncbi:MAG TPA: hypothetical protein PLF25_11715, partial [Accumulibacter sp.]|nr:hypothetical protein [Accumulibacter sp.]
MNRLAFCSIKKQFAAKKRKTATISAQVIELSCLSALSSRLHKKSITSRLDHQTHTHTLGELAMEKKTPSAVADADNASAAGNESAGKAESANAKPAARNSRARVSSTTSRTSIPRRASSGDVAPARSPAAMEAYDVAESASAAIEQKKVALRDIIAHATEGDTASLAKTLEAIMTGASPDDAEMLRKALLTKDDKPVLKPMTSPDDELSASWRDNNSYPYRNLMSRRAYEKQKYRLQV